MTKKHIVWAAVIALLIGGGLLHRTLTQEVDHHGTTKLMRAIEHHEKWKTIAKLASKKNNTLNIADRKGNTALFYAVRHRTDKNEIDYLLGAGADISAQNKQLQTVLFEAARFNPSPEIITFLCARGLPVNARDIDGNTPLILAARYNSAAVVKALLGEGADLEVQGADGRTARELLAENENLSEQEKTDFRQAMLVLSMLEARLAARERQKAAADALKAKKEIKRAAPKAAKRANTPAPAPVKTRTQATAKPEVAAQPEVTAQLEKVAQPEVTVKPETAAPQEEQPAAAAEPQPEP